MRIWVQVGVGIGIGIWIGTGIGPECGRASRATFTVAVVFTRWESAHSKLVSNQTSGMSCRVTGQDYAGATRQHHREGFYEGPNQTSITY